MHRKLVMQIFRSAVTIVVFGTMAAMIFSLRGELAETKAKLRAGEPNASGAKKPAPAAFVAKPVRQSPCLRQMHVDSEGVMRFDDGSEVALWGVNYYVPFTCDYRHIAELKLDHKAEIRKDLAHFKRLGLDSIRIHCFDRQFSTRDGGLIDNHHLELLDYLIAEAAKQGIYTMLTPIAWWGGGYAPEKEGFSNLYSMPEMTSKPEAWKVQARFLGEFAKHVNRYTHLRYADDPAISCFELINEPVYPNGLLEEKVVDYINALAAGIRSSGTKKPIFYNSWKVRNSACSKANIDGVTGSLYPTGLVAGHTLEGVQMGKIQASSINPDDPKDPLIRRARVIYEFDAADTAATCMYPTFARLFRHEGVQIANMFQYDPLSVAPVNRGWQTHFLNLVYAPGKAVSFAIAGEAFRLWRRNCSFVPNAREHAFPPYRMNAEADVSECFTEHDALYSNDTDAKAPSPEKLRRVWGVGSSSLVRSNGNGAYFLDRVGGGIWNLQLYPNVATVRDVHSGGAKIKKATSLDEIKLIIDLPDLGGEWTVWCNGVRRGKAIGGKFRFKPGEYLLTRDARLADDWENLKRSADLAEYIAPLGDAFYKPIFRYPTPYDFEMLDVVALSKSWITCSHSIGKDETGRDSIRIWKSGGFTEDFVAQVFQVQIPDDEFSLRYPDFRYDDENDALVFHIRSLIKETSLLEVVLRSADGNPWGTNIAITPNWQEVRLPLKSLRFFSHHVGGRQPEPGAKPSLKNLSSVTFCFGTWLFPTCSQLDHGVEISSIRISK